jgi:hypothetical protein
MERAELERLDRTALVAQAEALGVTRANILTRPELMDELLVRTSKKEDLPRARGFLGRARDLVARVIEKGLHLPDAADRLRQVSVTAKEVAARVAPAVVPTVTLAEIYAAQGHRARAIETLRRVMDLEPDHGAAEALLTKLETAPVTSPPPAPPQPDEEDADEPTEDDVDASHDAEGSAEAPRGGATGADLGGGAGQGEGDGGEPATEPRGRRPATPARRTTTERGEPLGFLDDEPLPIRYDVDECVAIAVDPVTLYVYWEVREATLARLRRVRPDGSLTLRLVVVTPSWDGPRSAIRDFDVEASVANRIVRDLPAGSVVRAAIGWRNGDVFLPVAHAPSLETPPGAVSPIAAASFVRWTPRGLAPVTPRDPDYPSIERALVQLEPHREALYERSSPPVGSSELSAGFSPTTEARGPGVPSSEALL